MMEENLVWEEPNNYYNNKNTDIDSEGEEGGKRTSWCMGNKQDEQQFREELIERATTRLRRRRLEQELQDVMSQVVSLQTQLESLRLDAITTIDTISDIFENDASSSSVKMNRQMDVLERRLSSHKSSLEQFTIHEQEEEKNDLLLSKKVHDISTPLTAMAMSRLSSLSLVSSIFNRTSECTSNTSISDHQSMIDDDCISHIESISGEDHPFYDLAGKRSFKEGSFCGSVYSAAEQEQHEPTMPMTNTSEMRWRRRQRRQRHQQHLEQQKRQQENSEFNYSDNESFISDDLLSLHKGPVHPLSISPITPPPNYHPNSFYFPQEDKMDYHDKTHSWLYATQEGQFTENLTVGLYPQRNVLDEAMSFLDSISENGDDMGFGEDFYLLLRNPDLCCRPLSEIQSTMQELRQETYLNPTHWYTMGKDMVYQTTCTSLQWCKFLSVLSAAVVISIMKGPEDVRRHSF